MTVYELVQQLARFDDPNTPISYSYITPEGNEKELYPDMVMASVINNKIVIDVREV